LHNFFFNILLWNLNKIIVEEIHHIVGEGSSIFLDLVSDHIGIKEPIDLLVPMDMLEMVKNISWIRGIFPSKSEVCCEKKN